MLLTLALSLSAFAAEPGAFTVSSWDETFYNEEAGLVWARVHYPAASDDWGADADPSAGPFPVIAFMHGAMGQAWMYEDVSQTFASMGFVVLTIDTEVGPWINTDRLAGDASAALHWLDESSADPEHWLHGMASTDDWLAMGHSMGGVALGRLVDLEPRVTTVVGFMPYEAWGDELEVMQSFGGAALYFAGSEDETSTPSGVNDWLESLDAAERGLLYEIEGAGHQAITDFEWGGESMDDGEQRERVIDLAVSFVQAEVFGQTEAYAALLCELPGDTEGRSSSDAPLTWAHPLDTTTVTLGLAERSGAEAVVYAGRGPGASDTAHGRVELRDAVEVARISLDTGLACGEARLPERLAGVGWVQVAFEGAEGHELGEVIDVFGVGDPGPESESEPDESELDESGLDDTPELGDEIHEIDTAGCATRPGGGAAPGAGFALLLLAGLRRRR